MKLFRYAFLVATCLYIASCGNNPQNTGHSTPIDSTNVKGAPPATYGPDDPARDSSDSNRTNVNDTGTKANNVHHTGAPVKASSL